MPYSRSAKKRQRQAEKARERNREQRSTIRTAVKKVRDAETPDAAEAAYREAEALLDRAATRRLIHPKTAARTKSRLSKVANKV